MSRLFNAYVMVDWSSAAAPKTGKDSVWIGVIKRDIRFRPSFEAFNPPTRAAAEAQLKEVIADLRRRNDKALIGFDFNLGFPAGTAEALKLKSHDWSALWAFLAANVVDKADNTNNRFGVAAGINRRLTGGPFPFWGCPPKDALSTLQPKKTRNHGPDDLPELRHAELAAKGAASIWKTYYNGSVGGQAILGMPAVRRIKQARGDAARVWPFETGFKALTEADLEGVAVVLAEVWPSMVKPQGVAGEVKDLQQVRTLAEHFARLDEASKLGALFGPPKGTAAEVVLAAEREEGWILGAGA